MLNQTVWTKVRIFEILRIFELAVYHAQGRFYKKYMKLPSIIIKELPQYLLDILIVNSIIIFSFAIRFNLDVNLKQIYSNSATFTYLTLFFTPIFLRFFYYHSDRYIISLISLVRSLTLSSTVILLISNIILPIFKFPIFKYRSLFIIAWLLNILILSIVKLSWLRTPSYSSVISKNNKAYSGSASKVYLALRAFRPDAKDLKSLLISVFQ
jgi:FlaA1/EpsC-like NDP-sugar epimerase